MSRSFNTIQVREMVRGDGRGGEERREGTAEWRIGRERRWKGRG